MKNVLNLVCYMLIAFSIHAQTKTITGTVEDQNGPLPGVNVIIKGTSIGTQTDFDGNYTIEGKLGDVLNFTFVGYTAVERTIGNSSEINVVLEEDINELQEVVVTAQGMKRQRKSLGYAVSQIFRRKPSNKTEGDVARVLSGKASGVKITSASGASGNANNVVIRGYNSIQGNNQALFVVDGVPFEGNKIINGQNTTLDPNNIKDVKVIKGLAAASLYGTAGSNGVVVITTKSGNFKPEEPKYELHNENYKEIIENEFKTVFNNPLSTFSIDVDKAGYSNIRRLIMDNNIVPPDAVKIEEMINYFNYDYAQPINDHPFAIHTEFAETPWNKNSKLVKIGLKGKEIDEANIPPSNITFLLDVSGSMNSARKLPLLKRAFSILVKKMRAEDKVSIVVYAGAAGLVLEPTSGDQKEKILNALNNLEAGGSTAGGAGIKLAYKIAEENFIKEGNNRVVLATDGDFNVGASSDAEMTKLIESKRDTGVFLSVLGFGYGNYKDSKLEAIADKGNGNHAYIDSIKEAKKVFNEEFAGTMYTIAKDVKIQVEFNPAKIKSYRLIGYENRLLEDEDFVNDKKDAGELGSGHTVTALYEVFPVDAKNTYKAPKIDLKYAENIISNNYNEELFTVKFRYKKPSENRSKLITHVQSIYEKNTSEDFYFSASVALFGMYLRNSSYDNDASLDLILDLAKKGKGKDEKKHRKEFIELVKKYKSQQSKKSIS